MLLKSISNAMALKRGKNWGSSIIYEKLTDVLSEQPVLITYLDLNHKNP